jgi:hypothetical protein
MKFQNNIDMPYLAVQNITDTYHYVYPLQLCNCRYLLTNIRTVIYMFSCVISCAY